jgi:hypothetical protein
MSIFSSVSLLCPACNTAVDFEGVHSLNADSRPDLRVDILEERFQRQECLNCGVAFRLDPDFNLLDTGRGDWIAAKPVAALQSWQAVEAQAQDLFKRTYGEEAPDMAREVGRELRPRLTFGWPALRERLLARDQGLDDVTLELCKAYMMRSIDSPISAESELRLLKFQGDDLVFGWLLAVDGSLDSTMTVARALYDQIAADEEGAWAELREALSGGCYFVDINRLLMA